MPSEPTLPRVVALLKDAYSSRCGAHVVARQGKGGSSAQWVLGDERFFKMKEEAGERVDYRTGIRVNTDAREVQVYTEHSRVMASVLQENLDRQPQRLVEAASSTKPLRSVAWLSWSSKWMAEQQQKGGRRGAVSADLRSEEGVDFEVKLRQLGAVIVEDMFPVVPNTGIGGGDAPSAGTYFVFYVGSTDHIDLPDHAAAKRAAAGLIDAAWPLLECFYPGAAPEPPSDPPQGLTEEFDWVTEGKLTEELRLRRTRDRGLRDERLQRDDYSCQHCGFRAAQVVDVPNSVALDAHHINPLSDRGVVMSTIEDLVTLCANCHRLIHALAAKSGACQNLSVEFLRCHIRRLA